MALATAAHGDLDGAQAWQAKAHVAAGDEQPELLLVDVILHLRRGNVREALATIHSRRDAAEPTMWGNHLKLLRVLEAFALSQGDGDSSAAVATLLSSASPLPESALAGHVLGWPTFAQFVDEHRAALFARP